MYIIRRNFSGFFLGKLNAWWGSDPVWIFLSKVRLKIFGQGLIEIFLADLD
jgi:hypothetical protein